MLKYCSFDIVFQEVPDEITLAVNLTRCPNRCHGCHSPWLREDTGMPLDEAGLSGMVENYRDEITCVCFMGGDADPREVETLSVYLHKTFPEIKTAWYSGREALPPEINAESFNYIKLGPYRPSSGGLRSPATNQHMYKIQQGGTMHDITPLFWKK